MGNRIVAVPRGLASCFFTERVTLEMRPVGKIMVVCVFRESLLDVTCFSIWP